MAETKRHSSDKPTGTRRVRRSRTAGQPINLRVVVVAGDRLGRQALENLLLRSAKDARPIAAVAFRSLIKSVEQHQANLVLAEARDELSLQSLAELRDRWPSVQIMALVGDACRRALLDGMGPAAGPGEFYLNVLRQILRQAPPEDHLPAKPPSAPNHERHILERLTDREREILALTAAGHSLKEIARRLHRAYGTIARHRTNIMNKLNLHDRVALTRFAIRHGLTEV